MHFIATSLYFPVSLPSDTPHLSVLGREYGSAIHRLACHSPETCLELVSLSEICGPEPGLKDGTPRVEAGTVQKKRSGRPSPKVSDDAAGSQGAGLNLYRTQHPLIGASGSLKKVAIVYRHLI